MSSDVSARLGSAGESIRKIGPALVIASTLGATLGIVIAQFLDDLGDGLLAEILGGDAVLYNNRTDISGVTDVALAGGFLLCLIVGLISLFVYPTARGQGVPRLTLLWMVLQVLRQAFGQAILLPFDDSSQLSLAYQTLDVPPGLDMVIAAGGAVGLLLVALSAASAFLAFTPHRHMISTGPKRFTMTLWLALIPAVAAGFLAIAYLAPDAGSGVVGMLPLTAVMFLATVAAAPGMTTVQGPEDLREVPSPWGLAATLLVILLLEQFILRGGIDVDPRLWGV